jgi:hypothetical protein
MVPSCKQGLTAVMQAVRFNCLASSCHGCMQLLFSLVPHPGARNTTSEGAGYARTILARPPYTHTCSG